MTRYSFKKNSINKVSHGWGERVLFFFVFISFVLFLFDLTVINGNKYFKNSVDNFLTESIDRSARGEIVDNSGYLLVGNKYLYRLLINEVNFEERFKSISEKIKFLLKKDEEILIRNEEKEIENYLVFDLGIEENEYKILSDNLVKEEGIVLIREIERNYNVGEAFSHVLGYIGFPSKEEIKESGVDPLSLIGKSGIEKYYDASLRGEDGKIVFVKQKNRELNRIEVNKPLEGSKVQLTINKEWQEGVYKLLQQSVEKSGAMGGAAIIIESESGKMLSLVSFPSYDPSIFNGGLSKEEGDLVFDAKKLPLLNKAISVHVSPGSIFKPIVALSALSDGVITPEYSYVSNGCESIGGGIEFCEADRVSLGEVNLYTAIARSSNLYFCNVGRKFDEKYGDGYGIQHLVEFTDKFGIGKTTGLDLPGEVSGTMASPEFIQKIQNRGWYLGDLCNTIIGQGVVSVTPIQMSVIAASYVNGGKILKPYLVEKVIQNDGSVQMQNIVQLKNELGIDPIYLDEINKAMRLTITDEKGSARALMDVPGNMRVKTGSADASERLQNGDVVTGAHSWVAGSFDFEGRQYSIVVFQQYGGRGFMSVPVAGRFVKCLYDKSLSNCSL